MDQEIASVLKKKPTISPVGSTSDLNIMQMRRIDPKRNSVMFTRNKGQIDARSEDDKKYFDDMIQWYIRFRQTILALIPRLFETTKKVPTAGPSKKK